MLTDNGFKIGVTMNLNQLNSDLTLKDALELLKRDLMLTLNCHAIAKVASFDPVKQTITATMNYVQSIVVPDAPGGILSVEYPILVDCPVIVFQGGDAALTMPIQAGDDCMILFNDRDLSAWFSSGSVTRNPSIRLHSFSDGVAIVGLNSLASSLEGYDTERAVLRKGESKVAVGDKLELSNSEQNVADLLQEFLTEVQDLATQVAALATATGNTSIASNVAAIGVRLVATSERFNEVLE